MICWRRYNKQLVVNYLQAIEGVQELKIVQQPQRDSKRRSQKAVYRLLPPPSPEELAREYIPCSLYIAHIDCAEGLPSTPPLSMA